MIKPRTMIKQITTAVLLTAVVIAVAIPHTSFAGRNSNPFYDDTLSDLRPNSGTGWHRTYKKKSKKSRKRKRRSSRNRKKQSVSPLAAEGIRLQKALRSMGHYDTPLDGKIDSYQSRVAIMLYQKRYGLPPTGVLSPKVEEVLLQQGDLAELSKYLGYAGDNQEDKAKRLQAALTSQGYYVSAIDGDFGSKSMAAMRLYQQANGMTPSGVLLPDEDKNLVNDSVQLLQNEQAQLEQTLARMSADSPVHQKAASTQTEGARQQPLSVQPLTPRRTMGGYRKKPSITTEAHRTGETVIREETVLKAGADSSSETLEWLSAGVEIKVNSIAGDWAYVSVNDQQGYVFAEFIEMRKKSALPPVEAQRDQSEITTVAPITGEAVVTEAAVLKAKADVSSETLEWLSEGIELTVNSVAGDWADVTANGQQGYVYAEFLEMRKKEVSPANVVQQDQSKATAGAPRTGEAVITEMAVLKAEANASSETVAGLSAGVELTVNSIAGDWAYVSVKGQKGYVYTGFLEMRKKRVPPAVDVQHDQSNSAAEAPKSGQAAVKNVAILKAKADVSSETLKWLSAGEKLTVISTEGNWAHVSVNGQEGYVYTGFIEMRKQEALPETKADAPGKMKQE
jgi:uncharacterized protein YgiM (DUF1202 family)